MGINLLRGLVVLGTRRADGCFSILGLYTDESPGLKVDPVVVVLVLESP